MKRMTQKMLSLLLAMAMVCTMLPAAMAKSNDDDYDIDLEVSDVETFDFYEEDDNGDSVYDGIDDAIDDYLSDDEYDYYLVDFDDEDNDSWLYVTDDEDYDYDEIDLDDLSEVYVEIEEGDDQWEGSYTVYGCVYGEDDEDDQDRLFSGDIRISFDGDADEEDIELSTSEDKKFYFNDDESTDDEYSVYDLIVDALDDIGEDTDDPYYVKFADEDEETALKGASSWVELTKDEFADIYLDIDPDDDEWTGSYTVEDKDDNKVLYGDITVTFDGSGYADEDIELTVDTEDEEFYFNDDDTDEGDSVQDAIIEVIDNELKDGYSSKSTYYVDFDADRGNDAKLSAKRNYDYDWVDLDDLGDIYLEINDADSWEGSYTVYETNSTGSSASKEEIVSGSLTINFGATGASGDIVYTATAGDEVELDIDDLEEFWDDYTDGKGSLQNVKFNSVSGVSGTLCYQHEDGERGGHTDAEGETYYVNASSRQDELEDLTFCPSKRSSSSKYPSGAATIRFTATGTTGRGSSRTDKASGTITILYTAGDVDSIDYAASSSHIFLDKEDFDEVYKDVTDTSSRNPNYSIKFLDVPTFGTIYLNARESRGSVSGTELTSRNKNQSISRSAIDKIAYEPGVRGMGDVVRYAVYSGGDLKYMGTINFGVTAPEIHYTCTGGRVTFQAVDFYQSASMLSSSISFGAPTSGGLYKNYTGANGDRVTSSDRFSLYGTVDSIATVSYVPVPGFSGLVEIPFTSYTTGGGRVNGVVKITVTAVTNVAFSDVPSTHWAANDIGRLAGLGIIKGTSNNTFSPDAKVKYGEALKMILMAAGYPDQGNSTTGHWASNYLTLAKSKGIVSGNVDLNAEIDRNTMAALAAKALGMEKAYSVNFGVMKPCDTTDGYVYALYNAGILKGNTAGGLNYFYGNQKFTRAEQAAVVCRMLDYKNK